VIKINQAWCKGCDICVAFCPKKVLALKDGKAYAANPEACIKCRLCEYRCPDFAIFVEKESTAEGGSQNE